MCGLRRIHARDRHARDRQARAACSIGACAAAQRGQGGGEMRVGTCGMPDRTPATRDGLHAARTLATDACMHGLHTHNALRGALRGRMMAHQDTRTLPHTPTMPNHDTQMIPQPSAAVCFPRFASRASTVRAAPRRNSAHKCTRARIKLARVCSVLESNLAECARRVAATGNPEERCKRGHLCGRKKQQACVAARSSRPKP